MKKPPDLPLCTPSPPPIMNLHCYSVLDTHFAHTWPSISHRPYLPLSCLPMIAFQVKLRLSFCRLRAQIAAVDTSSRQTSLPRRFLAIPAIMKMTNSVRCPIAVLPCVGVLIVITSRELLSKPSTFLSKLHPVWLAMAFMICICLAGQVLA